MPASDELSRLARRLERERAIRAEAERISERVTRDLYDRRAEAQLLETVARASNLAATVEEAMQVAVDAICSHTNWPIGHVYVIGSDGHLVPTAIWHLDDPEHHGGFRAATEKALLAAGVGLPGRVLDSAEPAWIRDVRKDPNFPRAQAAQAAGIRAAFASPVLAGKEVVAVIEFFSPVLAEPDEALLALMAQVGTQLGRVLERARADEERQRLTQQQQAVLECAGEGIVAG